MAKETQVALKMNATGNAARELGKIDSKLGGIDLKMASIVAGAAAVAAGVAKFVSDGIAAYSEFDTAITEINARTSLTNEELDQVAETAKRMGIETAFSATDAANSMLQLITSGSDAAEAMELLPDVLDLAAASGLDLETSADALTDVMKQFGLGTADATDIVNTLVAASQSSSATVGDLIAAMANGGAVASTYGLGLDETAAAMAVVAENGVKGAEAGTQLKSMLLQANRDTTESANALQRLGEALWGAEQGYNSYEEAIDAAAQAGMDMASIPPISFFNDDGSAREFADIMDEIDVALEQMTDAQRTATLKDLYGSYGQVAGAAIEGADGIDEMLESMEGQNSAAEVAQEQLESFDKQVGLIHSSIEGLMIEVMGPFVEDILKPMLPVIMDIINGFTLWIAEGDKIQVAFTILGGIFDYFRSIAENVVGVVTSLLQGDFAGAFEYIKALVEQVWNHIQGVVYTGVGVILTVLANFWGGLIGGALEGLDQFVKMFQMAFHFVRAFVHNFIIDVIGFVETLLNQILAGIEQFIRGALEPVAAQAGTIFDVGGLATKAKEFLEGFSLRVDLTSNLQRIDASQYTPTGLNLGDDIRGRVGEGIRNIGQDYIRRGGEAFERAQNVQVTNVKVEIGTNVGDNDELVSIVRQAARAGRIS